MYWFAVANCRYIGVRLHVFQYAPILKLSLKAKNSARTSDLTWSNYIVCPAKGDLLFNSQ